MRLEEIKELIETGMDDTINATEVMIEGDGTHFTAIVVSEKFNGKTRVEKQQMVYQTVREQLLSGSLHALSLKTYTPQEWFKEKGI